MPEYRNGAFVDPLASPGRYGDFVAWPGGPAPRRVLVERDRAGRAAIADRPRQFYTPKELAQLERIKQAEFFMMRNGRADDDPAVCPECGRTEMYLTLGCIERPFNGLVEGLYAFVVASSNREKARIIDAYIQDLEAAHPFTANKLRPSEAGEDLLAWSLGIAEPISRDKAYAQARAINDRGLQPPLVLEPIVMPRYPTAAMGGLVWR
jgi:hypothetical protein